MVDASVHFVDRGTVRSDANHVLEGFVSGTADEPNPDILMGNGPVYNLVIDHPEGTILWDSGSHPDGPGGYWPDDLYAAFEHADAADHPLDQQLGEVGFEIDDIDYVLQTHLHMDHAGGLHNFEGTDVPVFVHEDEIKHAYYSVATEKGDRTYVRDDFDRNVNWEVITRDRVSYFEDVEFLHLPGHTPGLLGVLLHLDDHGSVILTGDECYNRLNYEQEYPLGGELRWSARHWEESLAWLKDLERRHDADVFCGHDPEDAERLADGLP